MQAQSSDLDSDLITINDDALILDGSDDTDNGLITISTSKGEPRISFLVMAVRVAA